MAMKLSPMITTRWPALALCRICCAWALERKTNTCGKSAPGSVNSLGMPPVASSAAS
ncbi:hypothetical protein D3C71_1869780 [compost metagenome]